MNYFDHDKAKGLMYLSRSNWPSLPVLIVSEKQKLNELNAFFKQHNTVKQWIFRSLQPVPLRYKVGNHLVNITDLQHLIEQNWMLEAYIPFCLQPYINAVAVAGVFLIKGNQILAEFVSGSSGSFLRGLTDPYRCIAKVEEKRQVGITEFDTLQIPPTQELLSQVINAALAIPDVELLNHEKKLVEWLTTSEGEVFFVDYQLMPDNFIPNLSLINTEFKIIYPGSLDFPVVDIAQPLPPLTDAYVLVAERPRLEIISICQNKNVRGLLIKRGAFLSHVARFAGEKGIPCRFG